MADEIDLANIEIERERERALAKIKTTQQESGISNCLDCEIEVASFRSIMNVTIDFMHDYANGNLKDSTRGSMWYHRDDIKPDWTENLRKTAVFGRHIFYRK
jgi:hypothetical protein